MDGVATKRKAAKDETIVNDEKKIKSMNCENDLHGKDFGFSTSLAFSLPEDIGVLSDALAIFKNRQVNLKHIESRPSKNRILDYDFYVDIDAKVTKKEDIKLVVEDLKSKTETIVVKNNESIPWFPRKISDLDKFETCGAEFDENHHAYKDPVYRERRKLFSEVAKKYRHGDPLPYVEYTEKEIETWNVVFTELSKLYPTHACRELNFVLPLLRENCGYRVGNIPQLRDVSNFLKDCTGFTLRPAAGLISSRDFLAGLAFRVFHSTQYIRHWDSPLFSPEPDVAHELIGHVPLFADPSFADFSQEIGLASLGAPDEWIERLTAIYWFTAEVGLCRQNGEVKAYGAALLSSFGELKHCVEIANKHRPFEPDQVVLAKVDDSEYQHQYFVTKTFDDARLKFREWSRQIPRSVLLNYNPYTESVEVLDSKDRVSELVNESKCKLQILEDVLKKME